MATVPLGPDSAPVTIPGNIPPAPAVMAILDRFNRDEIGNTIEVLVALLDVCDGDADAQDTSDAEDEALSGQAVRYADKGPGCIASDSPDDQAYVEWQTMRGSQRGPNIAGHEDAEDDDSDCGLDEAEPNFVAVSDGGAGCEIADPGGCEHDGREEEHDMEREQMAGDVPMLAVVSAYYNVFTDKRVPLGISNLQSSFVGELRSADTGALHRGKASCLASAPGVPV